MDLDLCNIKIEHLIVSLQKVIKRKQLANIVKDCGVLHLHKEENIESSFGIYRVYCYNLYYITPNKNYHLLGYKTAIRSKDLTECDLNFMEVLFDWIGNDCYNNLIQGRYDKLTNE